MRKNRRAVPGAALAVLLLGAGGAAHAQQALVSNTGQTHEATGALATNDHAQKFSTGANADGYTLTGVVLVLDVDSSGDFPTVTLHSGSAAGTKVADFTAPSTATGEASYTFTPSAAVTLAASTDYWAVTDGGTGTWITVGTDDDANPATGWSIANEYLTRAAASTGSFTSASTSQALAIRVNGTIVPANSAPTASDGEVTASEDGEYSFAATDFNFEDADTGDTLDSVKIVTLPGLGTLALDGTEITSGDLPQTVTAAQLGTGDLV